MKGNWISVKERLPGPGRYLIYVRNNEEWFIDIMHRHDDCWGTWMQGLTHWMPLPEPPEEA